MVRKFKEYINNLRLNLHSYRRKSRISRTIDKSTVAHLEPQVRCSHRWYGNNYGGFYINPDPLDQTSIVYSFGIGKDISFDLACMRKHGCKVFGFDPTPRSIKYVKSIKDNPLFTFFDFGIASSTGYQTFYLPRNVKGVSGSMVLNETLDNTHTIEVFMQSFEDICKTLEHEHVDVIKMDIEGAEYDVLESILNSGVSIGQILVEFHDRLFDTVPFRSAQVVRMMKEKGYDIFAVSKSYEEVSFINNAYVEG